MTAQYQISKAINSQYYFVLTAENNEPILTSELYWRKDGARAGIRAVMNNSQVDERYLRLTSEGGKPYFCLRAENNEKIGTSERYNTKQAMEKGIQAVKRVGASAEVVDLT